MKRKAKTVSYYSSCHPLTPDAVDLFNDGHRFRWVTQPTDDRALLDAVRLASMCGGFAWRDGDGVNPNTRYGIKPFAS